ncbi:glycogen-binding domain-containing protein [Thermus caliditerrae]|uniref:glycogen-binding domain-containing protein n=1 Tax=Thermus caliditerrae TaxID=1330700 RepID=UPI00068AB8D8|nr:glycogen-binding domain-containing protein [Thermus caliditerrae]
MARPFFLLLLFFGLALAAPPRITPEGVVFCFYAPEAKLVTLPASFNGWDPGALPLTRQPDGHWCVTVSLAPGVYQYKYFVDGAWKEDPDALETADDGYGGRNGVVRVPGAEAKASYEAGPPRVVDGKVLFTYYAPEARSVSLRGSFNAWGETPMFPGGNGVWYVLLDLPPGRHQYKYYVDGVWTEDPNALDTTDDGYGGKNAVVELVRQEGALKVKAAGTGLGLKGFMHGLVRTEGLKVSEGRALLQLAYQAEDLLLAYTLEGTLPGNLSFQSAQVSAKYGEWRLALGFNAPLFTRERLSYVDRFGVGLTALGVSTALPGMDLGFYLGAVPGQNAYVLASLGSEVLGFPIWADAVFATGGWHLPSGAVGGGAFLTLGIPKGGPVEGSLNLGATFGSSVAGFSAGNGFGLRVHVAYSEGPLRLSGYGAYAFGDFLLDLAATEPSGLGFSEVRFRTQRLTLLGEERNGFTPLKELALEARYTLLGLAPFLRFQTDYQRLSGELGVAGEALGFSGEIGVTVDPAGASLRARGRRPFGLGTLYLDFALGQDLTPHLALAGVVPF